MISNKLLCQIEVVGREIAPELDGKQNVITDVFWVSTVTHDGRSSAINRTTKLGPPDRWLFMDADLVPDNLIIYWLLSHKVGEPPVLNELLLEHAKELGLDWETLPDLQGVGPVEKLAE